MVYPQWDKLGNSKMEAWILDIEHLISHLDFGSIMYNAGCQIRSELTHQIICVDCDCLKHCVHKGTDASF